MHHPQLAPTFAFRAWRPAGAGRLGLSLIEVMIAAAILAVGLTSVVGYYQNLHQARMDTREKARAQDVARTLMDRITGGQVQSLGNTTVSAQWLSEPWSYPRFEETVPGNNPPLTLTSAVANDNLLTLGLLDAAPGATDLRAYVEYYRGIDTTDPLTGVPVLGVMSFAYANREEFAEKFKDMTAAGVTWRTDRRLSATTAPYLQVQNDEPFVIRIIVTWGGRADVSVNQRLEVFAVKRRPTSD